MSFSRILPRGIKYKIKRGIKKTNHLWISLLDRSPKLLILLYHRILPDIKFNPLNTVMSLKTFARQIDELALKYPVVSLSNALEQCLSGKMKSQIQVVLTFDDGYADNYENAFPVLKQKGLPAVFFLATDYIDSGRPLWDWELFKILHDNHGINRLKIRDKLFSRGKREESLSFAYRVFDKIKSMPAATRQELLDGLKSESGNNPQCVNTIDRCITWEEARKMNSSGMDIGAHSLSHRSLSRIPLNEAIQEIRGSKDKIEKNINAPCLHFAFPFGSRNDYNQVLIDYVKVCGFKTCLLNIHGYNHPQKKGTFCFKRIIMDEDTDLRYLLG